MEHQFIDIKKQPVNEGDFIMYPVNTFLRCGVVTCVINSTWLRTLYARPKVHYLYGERVDEGYETKTQQTGTRERSIVKITGDELQLILPPPEFIFLMETWEQSLRKRK